MSFSFRSPSVPQLDHVADEELHHLASGWRTRALRGDREANGIAHAYEVEQRRRQRLSQSLQSPVLAAPVGPVTRSRPWWRFWAAA